MRRIAGPLLMDLRSGEAKVRERAARDLIGVRDSRVVLPLMAALGDETKTVPGLRRVCARPSWGSACGQSAQSVCPIRTEFEVFPLETCSGRRHYAPRRGRPVESSRL